MEKRGLKVLIIGFVVIFLSLIIVNNNVSPQTLCTDCGEDNACPFPEDANPQDYYHYVDSGGDCITVTCTEGLKCNAPGTVPICERASDCKTIDPICIFSQPWKGGDFGGTKDWLWANRTERFSEAGDIECGDDDNQDNDCDGFCDYNGCCVNSSLNTQAECEANGKWICDGVPDDSTCDYLWGNEGLWGTIYIESSDNYEARCILNTTMDPSWFEGSCENDPYTGNPTGYTFTFVNYTWLPPDPSCYGGENCGNNVVDVGETCDGDDWGSIIDCSNFDVFTGGDLSCGIDCHFNTSQCTPTSSGICGDGTINSEQNEECDGDNWGSITDCTSFDAFNSGDLSCGNDCKFNTTLCSTDECVNDADCDDGNQCTSDSCVSGSCENNVVADGTLTGDTCGIGACEEDEVCIGGAESCTPGTGSSEVCDGIDNDCDGETDEGGVCLIAYAYWEDINEQRIGNSYNKASRVGNTVKLVFVNSGFPEGTELSFEIYQENTGADDEIRTIINGNELTASVDADEKAVASWKILQSNYDIATKHDEFYFIVSGNQSDDYLTILYNPTDQFCSDLDQAGCNSCSDNSCEIAVRSVEITQGSEVCGFEYTSSDGCDYRIDCMCEWDSTSSSCNPKYGPTELSCSGTDLPDPGTCTYFETSTDDCTDGYLDASWTVSLEWPVGNSFDDKLTCEAQVDDPNTCINFSTDIDPAFDNKFHYDPFVNNENYLFTTCRSGSDTIPCPAQIALPFFNTSSFIIVIIVIIVIYILWSRHKK